jgi:hypothetical protein
MIVTGILRALVLSSLLAASSVALAQQAAPPPAPAPAAPAATPGRVLIEIYHIAPGKHEAFLRSIARFDEVNVAAGLPPRQLYVHNDGASWDFMIVQPADYPPGGAERIAEAAEKLGVPRGVKFFLEIRQYISEHTDTVARGPTTAADVLAMLDE